MASHNVCSICLRTLRQQLRQSQNVRIFPQTLPSNETDIYQGRSSLLDGASTSRRISLSPLLLSAQAAAEARPQPSSPPKTPEPPSKKVEQIPKPSPPSSAGFNIAAKVRQHASATTETYIAYGACETLVKECARQADYTIPQVAGKGASPPTTKDGEHLGVGKGWWYESKLTPETPPPST